MITFSLVTRLILFMQPLYRLLLDSPICSPCCTRPLYCLGPIILVLVAKCAELQASSSSHRYILRHHNYFTWTSLNSLVSFGRSPWNNSCLNRLTNVYLIFACRRGRQTWLGYGFSHQGWVHEAIVVTT